jgi:hypothetical protein
MNPSRKSHPALDFARPSTAQVQPEDALATDVEAVPPAPEPP